MADFSQIEKMNIALKQVIGIQGLSNTEDAKGLEWYEETYSWQPFILNNEVFATEVPRAETRVEAESNKTSLSQIDRLDLQLTPVPGTNNRAWASFSTPGDVTSPLLGDWLLPFYWGRGYAAQLFESPGTPAEIVPPYSGGGNEITTTQGAWLANYKMGVIIFAEGYTPQDMGWTTPIYVRVYRYVGPKGISGSTANVSLDDAYNTGREITADEGPVVINPLGDNAHLQLTSVSYTPSSGVSGQIVMNNGVLYAFDGMRTKWLSVDQPIIHYHTIVGDGNYLGTGYHSDQNSGFNAMRNGTIIAVSAAAGSGNQSKEFEIRVNGTIVRTFSLSTGRYSNASLNLDFNSGNIIQVFCKSTGAAVRNPDVAIQIAWRI